MMLREIILLVSLGLTFLLIAVVLLVPVCFRICWNKCGCCRVACWRCNKRKQKEEDEWVSGGETTKGVLSKRYEDYFLPSIQAQIFVYLCIGFLFVIICALTDVPFYVMWIVFFLVWAVLFIDFLKRQHEKNIIEEIALESTSLKNGNGKEKKTNFNAYEAAGLHNNSKRAQVTRYLRKCKTAIYANKITFITAILAIVIITGISTISSSCMCIAAEPVEGSTFLSRYFSHKYCETGKVCNVYFTLADRETDLIFNFHASERPDLAYVAYDVVSHTRNGSASVEEWVDAYAFAAQATTYKMNTVRELTRYVNWADITNLTSSTTYYFVAVYTKDGNTIVSSEYKIKTIPPGGNYSFITGGDVSTDAIGNKLIDLALATKPDFAIIGGDVAYDNGFKACYLRWDEWFDRWDKLTTKNEGGYSIPLMLAIGNHEPGSFGASPGDDPYYTPYFPQQLNLQNVDPRIRLSYHQHRFGNDTTIIILDSDVVARVDGAQKTWLESQLIIPSKLKIVVYHANIYPSGKMGQEMANMGKTHWVPLFDKYNVTVAFENHLHLYKRTKPLKDNKVNPDGVTYFGDGNWGASPNIVPLSDSFYIDQVSRKQHFFHVTVQNNKDIIVNAIEKGGSVFDSWEKHLP